MKLGDLCHLLTGNTEVASDKRGDGGRFPPLTKTAADNSAVLMPHSEGIFFLLCLLPIIPRACFRNWVQ